MFKYALVFFNQNMQRLFGVFNFVKYVRKQKYIYVQV